MKKVLCMAFSAMLLFVLTGCSVASEDCRPGQPQEASAVQASQENEEPAALDTTETFARGELTLEVSHVKSVRTESKLLEGIEPFEETIFTCCSGAALTVINADMSDPVYAEDHQAHPQWGLYDIETDTRTELTNETEPSLLDEATDAVFNLEASVVVLRFEFVK